MGFQGLTAGLLMLELCMSLALALYNPSLSSPLFTFTGSDLTSAASGATSASWTLLYLAVGAVIAAGVAGGVIAFAVGFPNQYALFAGVASVLLGLTIFPIGIFNAISTALPVELRAFFVFGMSMLHTLATVGFLKGNM